MGSQDGELYGAVLCAGFGTRMQPITDAVPKPLIPFFNRPMVSYPLRQFADAGIRDVGINTHHLADQIPPVVDRIAHAYEMRAHYTREWDIQGTAGGIRGIWDGLGQPDGTVVVSNSDSIFDIDLRPYVQRHKESKNLATLIVTAKPEGQPGRVWLDSETQLVQLRDMEAPDAGGEKQEYAFTGIHLIDAPLIDEIPAEKGCVIGDVYGPALEAGEPIGVEIYEGFWAAMDRPDLLFETTKRLLDEPTLVDRDEMIPSEGDRISPGATIAPDAQIDEPVVIDGACRIESGCSVGPYAVLGDTTVCEGTSVSRAVTYGVGALSRDVADVLKVADQSASLER